MLSFFDPIYRELHYRGVLIPPTPMGIGPISVRWEAESAQRADRGGARGGDFTQLRAAQMRKTLLLLVCVY
mgnify:CR=1 FL=1